MYLTSLSMGKKMLCMVGAFFLKCTYYPFILRFSSLIQETVFQKKKKKKKDAKVQFYCTGAKNRFCVDNQWCLGLKSQTNKRWYLRWRDLSCKEKYSLVA